MASTCFGPLHLVQLRRGTTQVAAIQDTNLPHEVMSECDSLSKGTQFKPGKHSPVTTGVSLWSHTENVEASRKGLRNIHAMFISIYILVTVQDILVN